VIDFKKAKNLMWRINLTFEEFLDSKKFQKASEQRSIREPINCVLQCNLDFLHSRRTFLKESLSRLATLILKISLLSPTPLFPLWDLAKNIFQSFCVKISMLRKYLQFFVSALGSISVNFMLTNMSTTTNQNWSCFW